MLMTNTEEIPGRRTIAYCILGFPVDRAVTRISGAGRIRVSSAGTPFGIPFIRKDIIL